MGDSSHAGRKSDHNLGNAIDITAASPGGPDVDAIAEAFRRQMMSNPGGRISYMIRNRRICSPRLGWAWRPYLGRNPHRTHLHMSIRADARDIVRPWSL
jgi:hypothetical protein